MNTKELFESFENDILIGCHSLRAEVSRSPAGKKIIAAGQRIFSELALHLKDCKLPTEIEAIANDVRHGWGMLLSWLCENHRLDHKGIAQNDFDSWVKWLEDFTQAPA
jgi:hypothetical protein